VKISEIRRLVKLVETSGISELEIEEGGARVKIIKQVSGDGLVLPQVSPSAAQPEPASPTVQVERQDISAPPAAPSLAVRLVDVTSPMVGTFYRAPSPEAPSYVQVGDRIKPGQVLCILEAMKLMNEIEAEVGGRIAEIAVENTEPVEFGQLLFRIEPD